MSYATNIFNRDLSNKTPWAAVLHDFWKSRDPICIFLLSIASIKFSNRMNIVRNVECLFKIKIWHHWSSWDYWKILKSDYTRGALRTAKYTSSNDIVWHIVKLHCIPGFIYCSLGTHLVQLVSLSWWVDKLLSKICTWYIYKSVSILI